MCPAKGPEGRGSLTSVLAGYAVRIALNVPRLSSIFTALFCTLNSLNVSAVHRMSYAVVMIIIAVRRFLPSAASCTPGTCNSSAAKRMQMLYVLPIRRAANTCTLLWISFRLYRFLIICGLFRSSSRKMHGMHATSIAAWKRA